MNLQPLVSIILPTFNGDRYLSESIGSCLSQTYVNWELVIVDDCSSDATNAIANEYAASDSRIRVIRHDVNRKLPAALNTGFASSKGELLTWTSDDNMFEPNALEVMAQYLLLHDEVDFVYAQMTMIDDGGRRCGDGEVAPPSVLRERNCVGACFLYRRRVYSALGDYADDMFLAEDYEYWLRVQRHFKMAFLPHVAPYRYRIHGQSLTVRRTIEAEFQCARAKARHAGDKHAAKRMLRDAMLDASWALRNAGQLISATEYAFRSLLVAPYCYKTWRALGACLITGAVQHLRRERVISS